MGERKTIPDYPKEYPEEWRMGYKIGHQCYKDGCALKAMNIRGKKSWDFWQKMAYANGALDGWITNAEIDIDLELTGL